MLHTETYKRLLRDFAAEKARAVAAEREACAKVADDMPNPYADAGFPGHEAYERACREIAAKIRERGK